MSNDEHHHFSGKTPIEKQHAHEHDTLQILQRLASDGRRDEFFKLLEKGSKVGTCFYGTPGTRCFYSIEFIFRVFAHTACNGTIIISFY